MKTNQTIDDIQKRVKKIYTGSQYSLVTTDNQIIYIRDIVYFTTANRNTFAVTEEIKYSIDYEMKELEKLLKGLFIRTHSYYLVKISKITHISRRYPNVDILESGSKECELHLEGLKETIPVTETYQKRVKKALGIKTFDYLIPDNPVDKKFRELGIFQFGWRELDRLDTSNPKEVKKFIDKWDIKRFSRPKMLKYFRQVGALEIDKRKVIKNIIYQLYQWIKKGIEPLSDGNIRSLWYRIKSVLAYHSNVLEPGDVDIFYDVLTKMIEDSMLFKYKDFGFMDVNAPYRGIGKTRPEIILASEKIGHFYFIKSVAEEAGASFICLKGEPAHISLEYFSDELKEYVKSKKKSVYVMSDIDPAGHSIEQNLIEGLEKHGHVLEKKVTLVDLTIFEENEVSYSRYPVVRYEKKGSEIIPITPSSMGQITKTRTWFDHVIKDERLKSTAMINGKKVVTIWGIESDAAKRPKIRDKFLHDIGQIKE